MAGFEAKKDELSALDVTVVAASVDALDKAKEVAGELSFGVAHGVTRENADTLGSWWDDNRHFIQPSEFLVNAQGKVVASSYSAGPLARMQADDVVALTTFLNSRET